MSQALEIMEWVLLLPQQHQVPTFIVVIGFQVWVLCYLAYKIGTLPPSRRGRHEA